MTAIVRGGWKLIDNAGALDLYNIHADPNEKSNQAAGRPRVFYELRVLLKQYVAKGALSPFE